MTTAETHAAITTIVRPFGVATKPRRRGGAAVLQYVIGATADRDGAARALKAEAARLRGLGRGVDGQSFELAAAIVRTPPNVFRAFA